ncbi:MAG: SpoIIE family protein phosphatase [Ekhidna sp.]|nr:SpoIIE family protein phosphatase [Ekhidna sp.]
MKAQKFFSEVRSNFTDILYSGMILNSEIKLDKIDSNLDPDDHEALVMRLYFLAANPEKEILHLINQYEEEKYLYMMKVSKDVWIFILSRNKSFAKFHFYVKFLLVESKLEYSPEEEIRLPEKEESEKIASAKRIQDMILPDLNETLSKFRLHEFFYQPQDVIGGDWYWIKNEIDETWIVIGDCTGHSVEGALASISIISILNQVYNKDLSPHMLIKYLYKSLEDIQKQQIEKGYGIGCELIVMKFNHKINEMIYSGTGLPLYYLSKGKLKFNPTRKAILNTQKILRYLRSRKIRMKQGDAIFTHSDGLADQFGTNGKKFNKRTLMSILSDQDSPTLSGIIEAFKNHKGNEPQTDDIVSLFLKI